MNSLTYSGFQRSEDKFYSLGEEWANAISHGAATVAAIVGLVFLIIYSSVHGTALEITTFTIFGSSLVILYLASTLYHSIPNLKAKKVLQMLDHSAIFLLIAGSYTPFTLNILHDWLGIAVCTLVWVIALFGIIFQPWLLKKSDWLNTALYLLQGWCVLLAIKPVIEALPSTGLFLLFLGGLLYSFGTIFFIWQRLPYHHAVWHLFVLGGSIAHYFAVFYTIA
jgi:hemolysin III